MKALFTFIIKPYESRYSNTIDVDGHQLIVNTSIEDHLHVSKMGVVVEVPSAFSTQIEKGDIVMVHHNIFRRYYDIRGNEKNSSEYFIDDLYFAGVDQIYAYFRDGSWHASSDYCFVSPVANMDAFNNAKEEKQLGILKIGNSFTDDLKIVPGDLIGFKPYREFEFIMDGERLYCMKYNSIVVKYEYTGNERAYNPSWAKSRGRIDKSS